jgi:hypothetical protein
MNIFLKFLGSACILCMLSCAKIPVQSVNLMQQIKDEGQRMHKLNIAYVNMVFESKNAEVDSFMKKEYIPEFLGRIKEGFDANDTRIDMNEHWPEVFPKIVPLVNAVRDSLRNALAMNKGKIVTKLNDDYEFYKQACDAQINLLSSATKLNNSTKQIFNSLLGKATGNKIDLSTLEQKLDGFLHKGEGIAQKILFLNESVQTLTGN